MYSQIVVPLDGGSFSARALGPAARLAAASNARLVLASYALTAVHTADQRAAIDALRATVDYDNVTVKIEKVDDVARAIARAVGEEPGSLVCMSSVGRTHTGHVLGSVAEGVLREVTTPIVLVGPAADTEAFDLTGVMTVCVDGATTSETIVPIAASWAIAFGLRLRVVSVQPPSVKGPGDGIGTPAVDSAYVQHIVHGVQKDVPSTIDFDVLHGKGVVDAILADARAHDSVLIAAATHGATGLHRVVAGSVTMGLVHRARCPVLAYRPLQFLR